MDHLFPEVLLFWPRSETLYQAAAPCSAVPSPAGDVFLPKLLLTCPALLHSQGRSSKLVPPPWDSQPLPCPPAQSGDSQSRGNSFADKKTHKHQGIYLLCFTPRCCSILQIKHHLKGVTFL